MNGGNESHECRLFFFTHKPQELSKSKGWDSPGDTVVKNLPANAGDTGSSPGPGRSHMPRTN